MDLDELRVFISVVERGSLAAAAKSLRFPIATLRRRLNELEARLGVKLLERNQKGAVPTGAGAVLVERARVLLRDVQSLSELVRSAGDEPSGEVRVALAQGLPPQLIVSFLRLTMELYPKVTWSVRCLEEPWSALPTEVHAAVCITDRPPEGAWASFRLAMLSERLLATRAYLDAHGTPKTVADLEGHRLLVWDAPGRRSDELPLMSGAKLPIQHALRMNDIFVVRQAALGGLGIAYVPDGPLPLDLLSFGEDALVRVLDGVAGCERAIWLLTGDAAGRTPFSPMLMEQLTRLVASLA
jgi:DNA-binding transcriptional LysR family regulator